MERQFKDIGTVKLIKFQYGTKALRALVAFVHCGT